MTYSERLVLFRFFAFFVMNTNVKVTFFLARDHCVLCGVLGGAGLTRAHDEALLDCSLEGGTRRPGVPMLFQKLELHFDQIFFDIKSLTLRGERYHHYQMQWTVRTLKSGHTRLSEHVCESFLSEDY